VVPDQISSNNNSSSEKTNNKWDYDPDEHGFRRIVRNFAPSWFIITMSTGILSIIIHKLPYNGHWLQIIATIFFVLNVVLFITFSVMSGLRYAMYPELWGALFRDHTGRFFVGAVPTGLFTIINMMVLVCAPAWGEGWVTAAWVLWWFNSVLSLAVFAHLTFAVINISRTDLSAMSAIWLLSIVPAAIASASGGILARALPNPQNQLLTLIISYILWGTSIPLAFIILVLYFHRLTVHEMLSKEAIVTVLLPLAPLSLGGFALMQFGRVAIEVFPKTHSIPLVSNAADILYVLGFISALIMWGFGIVWFFLALAMLIQSRGFPFNMGWWGFIFPIGVFALSTFTLGEELESKFFNVLGTVLTGIAVLLWIIVAIGTVKGSLTGKMFYAPCLETDMKLKEKKLKRLAARMAGHNNA